MEEDAEGSGTIGVGAASHSNMGSFISSSIPTAVTQLSWTLTRSREDLLDCYHCFYAQPREHSAALPRPGSLRPGPHQGEQVMCRWTQNNFWLRLPGVGGFGRGDLIYRSFEQVPVSHQIEF